MSIITTSQNDKLDHIQYYCLPVRKGQRGGALQRSGMGRSRKEGRRAKRREPQVGRCRREERWF